VLKITRSANGEVVFRLSGRMDEENVAELKELFGLEALDVKRRSIVLDLKDLTLVDRDAVRFLGSCEADSIKLKNCPPYIREWITRERRKA
jgi:anti-anti-sigma regulatory factor